MFRPFIALLCLATIVQAGEHPRLLVTPAKVEAIRARLQTDPSARTSLEVLKSELADALAQPIALPPRPGNWPHFYVCPKHGSTLQRGRPLAEWSWEHVCPADNQVFLGDASKPSSDLDAVEFFNIHTRNAQNVLRAGLLYQITGERAYVDYVRDVARAYAERCDGYAASMVHDGKTPGIVQWAGLDQAVWQIPMMQGVDCVWTQLSEADRRTIADKVFLAGAKRLQPQVRGIGNHQTWKNGAIGLTGFLLDDRALIDFAIDHPESGDRKQLEKGVLPDGQWFEGSWGYHNYTVNSLWPLVVAAGHAGVDLYTPQLKAMFDGPLAHALPNLSLPMFNDTWPDGVQRAVYPIAYAHWKEAHYLDAMPAPEKAPVQVLVFGTGDPTAPHVQQARSSASLPSGYTILRAGSGTAATWLNLKYGPHGGGHGHPDKNSFILYSRGEVLMPDFGSVNYASKLHKEWARSTLAHNTLIIDGRSQAFTAGRQLAFDSSLLDGRVQAVSSDAGKIAPGVKFVRTVAMCDDNLIVVVDRVTADAEHDYAISAHHAGKWIDPPSGELWTAPVDSEPAYSYLQSPTSCRMDEARVLRVESKTGLHNAFVLPKQDAATLVVTTGPDRDAVSRVPMFLLSRRAKDATFVWAIALGVNETPPAIAATTDGDRADVTITRGRESLRLGIDSSTGRVTAADKLVAASPTTSQTMNDNNPLPAGGEVVFPAGDATSLRLINLPDALRKQIAAPQGTSGEAFEVDVDRQGDVPWSFLLLSTIDRPWKKGDVGLVSFWARNEYSMTGSARLAVAVEESAPPKPKLADVPVTVGTTWQRVDVPFVAAKDYPAGGTLFNIRLGYAKQKVQFAGAQVLNFGQSTPIEKLPRIRSTYNGREPGAAWRTEALARIEKIRKGDLPVRVVDAAGQPVAGAAVHATLKRHEFGFGTCISMKLLDDDADAERYRQTIKQYFNHAVIENELKWPAIMEHNYAKSDRLVQWLRENDIAVRGHVLVWPGERWLPKTAIALGDQPDKLAALIDEHITRTVARYRGQLIDWDVVNEPYANHWAMDRLGGNDVMASWFKLARTADPEVKLWINDYEILASGDMLNTPHQNHFFNTVKRLKELGAPVDGVGMQGHFGSNITSPENLLKILDRFASLGVRIKVTELDMQMGDEELRADYYRDFFITLFSHPNVDAIMQWGFWEGSHWIPPSALWQKDWTLRPHGRVFVELMNRWNTDITATTDSDGTVRLRGFKGKYAIEVKRNDQSLRTNATVGTGSESIELRME